MTNSLLSAAKAARALLKTYVDEMGGCDHSVNICCCDDVRLIEELDDAIRAAERTPDPIGDALNSGDGSYKP